MPSLGDADADAGRRARVALARVVTGIVANLHLADVARGARGLVRQHGGRRSVRSPCPEDRRERRARAQRGDRVGGASPPGGVLRSNLTPQNRPSPAPSDPTSTHRPFTSQAMADDVAAREDKRRDTSARVDKETLASLRALEKEIEADAWMYAKPRSTVR